MKEPIEEEEAERKVPEERGIGKKIQWELLVPIIWKPRNPPQPQLIGKSFSHDPHVPLHFQHVGNTTHMKDVLLLDSPTLHDSSLSL